MEIERRKYQRIGISFPVECCEPNTNKYFYTVIKDISLGGVKLITENFLPKESLIRLNINFVNNTVTALAKVCWCNKARISDRYFSGLEFVDMDPVSKQSIVSFLQNIQA